MCIVLVIASLAYISEKLLQTEVLLRKLEMSDVILDKLQRGFPIKVTSFKNIFLSGFSTLLEQSACSITCSISAFKVYSVILKIGSNPFLINYF